MIITSGGVKGWNTMGYLTPNPVCFKDICKKKCLTPITNEYVINPHNIAASSGKKENRQMFVT